MKTLEEKYSSFNLRMLQDKENKYKYYIMLDGYLIGVQYNLGSN